MPYAEVNDIRMYYEERGSGVPFVLMHGATGSIDRPSTGWTNLMPLFAEKYRAIHVELRGHGRTTNPAGHLTYAMIAEDIGAFIEQLDLAPAHIGGFSDGGIVALHIGMTRPDLVRSLVVAGAHYYNDAQVEEASRFVDLERIEREQPGRMAELAARHDRNKEPGSWRALMRQLAENWATNPAYTNDDLARITTPALLMAGEDDPWANTNQMIGMKRHIPHAEWLIVNHAGHQIQFTHDWIVGPVVMDFLERHPG